MVGLGDGGLGTLGCGLFERGGVVRGEEVTVCTHVCVACVCTCALTSIMELIRCVECATVCLHACMYTPLDHLAVSLCTYSSLSP